MKWNSSWLMILCVVGMGAILLLPALGISLGGLLGFALVLLCPLSHLLMMRRGHSQGGCHGEGTAGQRDATPPAAEAPRPLARPQQALPAPSRPEVASAREGVEVS